MVQELHITKQLKLKTELEEAGYEVFMLYVYTDLERSLKTKPR